MEIPKYTDIIHYKGQIDYFLKNNYIEFFDYINKKYNNIANTREKLYLFYFNLTDVPKCIICGKKSIFFGLKKGYSEYCSNECANKSPKRIEKINNTCLQRYGVNNYSKTEESKEKIKQTKLERYGDENFVNSEKRKQTCLEKYNCTSYTQTQEFKDKSKQTCLEKYGTVAYQKTNEFSEIIRAKLDIIQQKIYKTKKQNNSFNSSSIEKQFEEYLKENNINYKTQYKSEVYPFSCDFYFPDNDLYLEINAHWTHGCHPFDSTNKDDLLLLEKWKSKNTEFYNNAIQTWTVRDVHKRETAKKNNLKYIEFFTNDINEIKII